MLVMSCLSEKTHGGRIKDYVEIRSDLRKANGHSRKDDLAISNTGWLYGTDGPLGRLPRSDVTGHQATVEGVVITESRSQGESMKMIAPLRSKLRMNKKDT
jgi:hypothetical protein